MKMESKNMLDLVVGIAVGVLVLSAALFPVIDSNTDQTLIKTNVGTQFMTPDDGEHTIVIDYSSITFDGKPCVYPDMSLYGSATVMLGSDWFFRLEDNGTRISYIIAGPNQQYDNIGNTDSGSATITVNGTDVTIVGPTSTLTKTNLTYMISDDGNYVLSHDPYVLETTSFVGGIRNNSNNVDVFEIISGTFDDPDNIQTVSCRVYGTDIGLGSVTSSEYTIDLVPAAGNLKRLSQINQTAELTGSLSTATKEITIDYLIVPEKITYTNPNYVGDDLDDVFSVIPLLIIVGLIMGIVGVIASRRLE